MLLRPLETSTLEAAGTECRATRFLHLVLTGKRTGCSARLGFANAGEDTRLQTIYICSKKSSLKRSCFPKNIFYEIGVKWSKCRKLPYFFLLFLLIVCTMCELEGRILWKDPQGQKLDPLELETQVVLSHYLHANN